MAVAGTTPSSDAHSPPKSPAPSGLAKTALIIDILFKLLAVAVLIGILVVMALILVQLQSFSQVYSDGAALPVAIQNGILYVSMNGLGSEGSPIFVESA